MRKMTLSDKGVALIREFEGCKLNAYLCPAGKWTIGYGHTKGVRQGMTITQQQADDYLRQDIAPIEKLLNVMGINFRQEQFDALVSWIFNLGEGNFRSSTMTKYIMSDKADEDITDQMIRWINAAGRPLLGLKRRRVAEANLWLGKEKYYLDQQGNIKKH